MKKRILSVILSFVLCVVGIPYTVQAEENIHVHDGITFLPWDSETALISGNYYLTQDTDLPSTLTPSGTVNFCLNGNSLKRDGNGRVITVGNNTTMNLYDCFDTGVVTGGNSSKGGAVYVLGNFNMYGGNITGNHSSDWGGAIYTQSVSYGTGNFTMYGGTISNNTSYSSGTAIYSEGASLQILGGVIENHNDTNDLIKIGGGRLGCIIGGDAIIQNNKCSNIINVGYDREISFDINENSKIINNECSNYAVVNYCGDISIGGNAIITNNNGGIYGYENVTICGDALIANNDGGINSSTNLYINGSAFIINNKSHIYAGYDLIISGGTIMGNSVTKDYGVLHTIYAGKNIIVSGNPIIINNTFDENIQNVYVKPTQLVIGENGLSNNAKIGITLSTTTGEVTSDNDLVTANYVGNNGYLVSDNSDYITWFNDKNVTIQKINKSQYELTSLSICNTSGEKLTTIPAADFWATISIKNIHSQKSSMVLLASYDAQGRYIGMHMARIESAPIGSEVSVSYHISNANNVIATLKAFCVDSFSSFIPLSEPLSIT